MKIFGIDPGSERTGYGCVETDGSRHRIVVCGAITTPALAAFPDKLLLIHSGLAAVLRECRPQAVAIDAWGMAAVAGACLAWAIDNNLTQRLSLRDPLTIVCVKGGEAGWGSVTRHGPPLSDQMV